MSDEGSVGNSVGMIVLSINISYSEREEINALNTSELTSECINLGIESFSRCIGTSPVKEVENGQIMVLHGSYYCVE
jgi:hypothetical protein